MKKASEYRGRAEECRALAGTMRSDKERDLLLNMAANWDRLAADRSALIRRYPALAIGDEHREEAHHRRTYEEPRWPAGEAGQ